MSAAHLILASFLAVSAPIPPTWQDVTITGVIADSVKVFGENCKGDQNRTLTPEQVKAATAVKLRPSGGCVALILPGEAEPVYVVERALALSGKIAKPIVCPEDMKMTEKDKTSATSMGLGGECVPRNAPAAN